MISTPFDLVCGGKSFFVETVQDYLRPHNGVDQGLETLPIELQLMIMASPHWHLDTVVYQRTWSAYWKLTTTDTRVVVDRILHVPDVPYTRTEAIISCLNEWITEANGYTSVGEPCVDEEDDDFQPIPGE